MTENSWRRALADHLARYPLAEPVDVGKYVAQALYGPRHKGAPTLAVLEAMRAELDAAPSVDADIADALIVEPLGPEGTFARVHLRAWAHAFNGDLAPVARALRMTIQAHALMGVPSAAARGLVLAELAELRPDWPRTEVEHWLTVGAGYHHSAAYHAAYRPCYRVVRTSLLPAH